MSDTGERESTAWQTALTMLPGGDVIHYQDGNNRDDIRAPRPEER